MSQIHSTIACNLDADLLSAAYPLLAEEKVAALEWSFDALYKVDHVPDWFRELLGLYAGAGRLVGHGVFFSLFSGRWSAAQQRWLEDLRKVSREFQFDHITEHFGFMTGRDFHQGAPMPVPFNRSTLALGQDRLKRIQDACGTAVGLENLAFSYSLDDVKRHGEFLEKLVEPVNGFIILDLHNFYCQSANFLLDYEELLTAYPLHLVREIHISGGSWDPALLHPARRIRRDTHDDAVPRAVFDLLERVIDRCINLKFVVMEQLGTALGTAARQEQFRQDYLEMDRIVSAKNPGRDDQSANRFNPGQLTIPAIPVEDETLFRQQQLLATILETSVSVKDAMQRLSVSELAGSAWAVESWQPYMLETAMQIARKWKDGFR